jgi:hypothetical protein
MVMATKLKPKKMNKPTKVVNGDSGTTRQRVMLSELGEYYSDLLVIEAKIKNRPVATEASSLLCAKLMERETSRNKMLDHLAWKRGVTRQEVIRLILSDKLGPINPADIPPELAGEI